MSIINDHYGHAQGDDCLKSVASAIASGAASNDGFAARYGGEEFVDLLRVVSQWLNRSVLIFGRLISITQLLL